MPCRGLKEKDVASARSRKTRPKIRAERARQGAARFGLETAARDRRTQGPRADPLPGLGAGRPLHRLLMPSEAIDTLTLVATQLALLFGVAALTWIKRWVAPGEETAAQVSGDAQRLRIACRSERSWSRSSGMTPI